MEVNLNINRGLCDLRDRFIEAKTDTIGGHKKKRHMNDQ